MPSSWVHRLERLLLHLCVHQRPSFLFRLGLRVIELGLALGLGILTKGHIPVLLLMGPLLIEILIRRRFNARKVARYSPVARQASPWPASA